MKSVKKHRPKKTQRRNFFLNRFWITFYFIFFFSAGFIALKPKLSQYLLIRELSSDKKVQEIITDRGRIQENSEVIFNNQSLGFYPQFQPELTQLAQPQQVLGVSEDRWIEINLTEQKLYRHEGDRVISGYLVSTGLWARTPTGNFRVWIKLPVTTMKGGSKELGTYYYLPNIHCTMYFYKGYGTHEAYWHNNFGHPMSHGCVNMRLNDACEIYNWASVGTRVNIHY